MKKSNIIPVLALAASLVLGAAAEPGSDSTQPSRPPPKPKGSAAELIGAGRALEMAGQKHEALADYSEAIESRSLDRDARARALFARGLLLDGMGRLNDALRDYGAALSLSPKFAAALNNRANVYRRLGRFAEADRDYHASLAAGNPQSQYPYYGLGLVAEAQGKTEQAKNFYGKALRIDPNFALAIQKMAVLAAPIHLHAPKVAQTEKPAPVVLLHPPPPMSLRRPPAPIPASYKRNSPSLKPALDQGDLGAQVQLGAWRTETEAAEGWDRAVKKADGVLEGYSHHIVAADLPGTGRYYRLRVLTDKSASRALCTALQAKGLACIPARN
jgi:tetratricopeptide (TPR) repeat protein